MQWLSRDKHTECDIENNRSWTMVVIRRTLLLPNADIKQINQRIYINNIILTLMFFFNFCDFSLSHKTLIKSELVLPSGLQGLENDLSSSRG